MTLSSTAPFDPDVAPGYAARDDAITALVRAIVEPYTLSTDHDCQVRLLSERTLRRVVVVAAGLAVTMLALEARERRLDSHVRTCKTCKNAYASCRTFVAVRREVVDLQRDVDRMAGYLGRLA